MTCLLSKVLWVRWLLMDLGETLHEPTPQYCENHVVRNIANNLVLHERRKHVDMDCYFVRERVDSQ